jgi:tRNA threonylcarbamoyl adenosine modification protein (Sua5/YciO/YrdC/YwlC family)
VQLELNATHPEPRKIARAVAALRQGEVIVYPTDTVYGIGCALGQKRAIDRIFHLTGKDDSQLLTLICADLSDIAKYAVVENPQYRLLKRLLPGAYTFILPATKEVPRMLLTGKRKTIGIRVPNHAVPRALVAELGAPLVSTSASYRGEEPLNDPAEIVERFKGIELVLDAGYCGIVPSTIVDLSGPEPEIVRVGAGDVDAIG